MQITRRLENVISALLIVFILGGYIFLNYGFASASESIDVWWPTEASVISGTQPFKATLQNKAVNAYQMFWQVDNGQWNLMPDNFQDHPHKEVIVDLSGWTWRGSGPYHLNFIATGQNGRMITQRSLDVYVGNLAETPSPSPSVSVLPAPSPLITPSTTPSPSPSPSVIATSSPTPVVTPIPSPSPISSIAPVVVTNPTNNATVSGNQTLKAFISGLLLNQYRMFWQVDGDRLNPMIDNTASQIKEADVNFTGWNWHGAGPYLLNFVATDLASKVIGQRTISINVAQVTIIPSPSPSVSVLPAPSPSTSPSPTPSPAPSPTPSPVSTSNPFAGAKLWVNPNNDPSRWVRDHAASDPYNASLMDQIARQPETQWFGNWNNNVFNDVQSTVNTITAAGALPVFVAYNIPQRDCGGYSAGGSGSPEAYRAWIRDLANGIGNHKAVVLLEPDALSGMNCLSAQDQATRLSLIQDAVNVLNAKGNISVYIDAGNPNWLSASEMASRLLRAGVAQAKGFSLNISNFFTNADNINYGTQISNLIGGKHFVVETSRNGLGPTPDYQWCNPPGRALGNPPTVNSDHALVDAYLWVKGPAGSDGQCNGGPAAGIFWPEYALDLASRTSW